MAPKLLPWLPLWLLGLLVGAAGTAAALLALRRLAYLNLVCCFVVAVAVFVASR